MLTGDELPEETPGFIWQWYLLKKGIACWKEELSSFGTLVRYRTDLRLPSRFSFSHCTGRSAGAVGLVYANSDSLFYAEAAMFIETFSSLFDAFVSSYSARNATVEVKESYQSIVRAFEA